MGSRGATSERGGAAPCALELSQRRRPPPGGESEAIQEQVRVLRRVFGQAQTHARRSTSSRLPSEEPRRACAVNVSHTAIGVPWYRSRGTRFFVRERVGDVFRAGDIRTRVTPRSRTRTRAAYGSGEGWSTETPRQQSKPEICRGSAVYERETVNFPASLHVVLDAGSQTEGGVASHGAPEDAGELLTRGAPLTVIRA